MILAGEGAEDRAERLSYHGYSRSPRQLRERTIGQGRLVRVVVMH